LHYDVEEIPSGSSDPETARKGFRSVFLGSEEGTVEIPVYDRQRLTNGHKIMGPALVDSEQTTVFISPGWEMNVDRYNNAVLEEVS
jgi:N-methylhydantoinase A/oxoprolinase/acetone carboxylase beta subunit